MKLMAIEKYHDNTFGTFLWNDILFVCEISGVLPPERGGKVFGEFDFTSVVSCETLHEKPLLGLHRSIDVGEIEVGHSLHARSLRGRPVAYEHRH